MNLVCPNVDCKHSVFYNLSEFLSHLNVHGENHVNPIDCPFNFCLDEFTKTSSLYRHCYRRHSEYLSNVGFFGLCGNETQRFSSSPATDANSVAYTTASDVVPVLADNQMQISMGSDIPSTSSSATGTKKETHAEPYEIEAASFILRLKEKHNLTQGATDEIVENVLDLMKSGFHAISSKMFNVLPSVSNAEVEDAIRDMINDVQARLYQFNYLRSHYKQEKFFLKNFGLVLPREIPIGRSMSLQQINGERQPHAILHYLYYISIKETLQVLLKNRQFSSLISNPSKRQRDGLLHDFYDGSNSMNNPIIQLEKTMELVMYFDEAELCNPIGSRSGVHKLGFLYFTLVNIPPKYRSRLQSIFLLGVVNANDIKKFGIDTMLDPFIKEITEFSTNGFQFSLGQGVEKWKGSLVAVVADTLAAHQIGGFKEGVGFATQKCRNCMCNFQDMNTKFSEEMFVLRDIDTHIKEHCSGLTTSVESGVNRHAAIVDIPYYNIFDSMPQDVMHVLLEGCLPYTLRLVMENFMQRRLFGLEFVNESIRHFDYSYIDVKSKPSLLSPQATSNTVSLRQSASQMWLLGRLLPLFISSKIDVQDPVWQCYITLLNVMSLALAPCISTEEIEGLKCEIRHYLFLFKECFPQNNIIPKQHYLLHLPTSISKMGPLIRFWAMRFEAKHSFFKGLSRIASFKNIAKYMSIRHQHHLCMELLNNGEESNFLTDRIEFGPQLFMTDEQIMFISKSCKIPEGVIRPTNLYKWFSFNGSMYKANAFVVTSVSEDLPVFGEVLSILGLQENFYLHLRMYKTMGVDENLNSYVVQPTYRKYTLIRAKNLIYHEPFAAYPVPEKFVIPIKYVLHHENKF